ncbi:MAG: ankyrin repeat domain-containing protein [Spirochaetia bacterium]
MGGRKGISLPSKGVDLEARSKDGTTALMFAAVYNENPEVLATLLDAGADAKAKNGRGNTAFDYARNNYSLRSTEAFRKLEEALQ